MVRFWGLVAFAASLVTVSAHQGNIGWSTDFNWERTSAGSDPTNENIFVGTSVGINRDGSSARSIVLKISATPYRVLNTSYTEQISDVLVYSQTIDVADFQGIFYHDLQFEFVNIGFNEYILKAEIETPGNEAGGMGNAPSGCILEYNTDGKTWTAVEPAVFEERINREFEEWLREFPFDGVIGDIDAPLIEPPGRTDSDPRPEIPKDNAPGNVTAPGNNTTPGGGGGRTTTTRPGSITTTSCPNGRCGGGVTTPCPNGNCGGGGGGTSTPCPGGKCGSGGGDGTNTRCPNGKCSGGGSVKYDSTTVVTILKTTTVCPTPTPPPPCPETEKKHHKKRAVPGAGRIIPAYIKARILFTGRNLNFVPVRGQLVGFLARVYDSSTNKEIGNLVSYLQSNNNGEGIFPFDVREGQRIEIYLLATKLEGAHWSVGSRKADTDRFQQTWRSIEMHNDPLVLYPGETKEMTYTFPFDSANKAFWVADILKTVSDYAKDSLLLAREIKPIVAWWPSLNADPETLEIRNAFFAGWGNPAFINLPWYQALNPAVIAHEYGHFLHYLSRGSKLIDSPNGMHWFCEPLAEVHPKLAFAEGFATAFGSMAIDGTIWSEDYLLYTQRSNEFDPREGPSMEDSDCWYRGLARQEGRVAAAILDMTDRFLDDFPTESNDFGRISTTFDPQLLNVRFDPRFVFWIPMITINRYTRALPNTIHEYWQNVQQIYTPRQQDKVWAIFEWNWADFLRDEPRPLPQ